MTGHRTLLVVSGVAVLAVCGFAAWLVLDVGCEHFADRILFRQFCDKSSLALSLGVLGIVAVLLVIAAIAQSRGRGT